MRDARCESSGEDEGTRGQGGRQRDTGREAPFGRRRSVDELCMLMRRRASVGDWETGRGAAVS
jgi:hypothetical protein